MTYLRLPPSTEPLPTMAPAEILATIFKSYRARGVVVGRLGVVVAEFGETVWVRSDQLVAGIRSVAAGWSATVNNFEGIDQDLERAIDLALSAARPRNRT